jgi:hypothetical protein
MRILFLMMFMSLVGCGSYENDKIDHDKAKTNNPLLVPPYIK